MSSSSRASTSRPFSAMDSFVSVNTPFCTKRKLREPLVPSEQLLFVKMERTMLTVRLLLSLRHSITNPMPEGPYPSKTSGCRFSGSLSARLMARSMLSFGILTPLALLTAILRRGLPSISAPPSLTATVISLIIRENSLLRFASAAPFLCLMVDHLLCPDIEFFFLFALQI